MRSTSLAASFVLAAVCLTPLAASAAEGGPATTPADPSVTDAALASPPQPLGPEPAGAVNDEMLRAGWHGGLFYMRSAHDEFRLYVQGRAQIDMFNYFGPGVADTTLKSTIFLRRVRPELTGEFMEGKWQWMLAGDWGMGNPTTDNANGKTAGAAQTTHIAAVPTDVFVNYHPIGLFNIQVGQFDVPFTMENRTSDKYIPFMERSLAVRVVGIPTNKDIGAMVWGETPTKVFFYSVGVFDGDGQNRPSVDNRADVYGRLFLHPLIMGKGELQDLQIGASFHYGQRDKNYVNYDYNSTGGAGSMSTQGNYAFWKATYGGSKGTTHVLPSGSQAAFAAELRIPFKDLLDVWGEFVYINNQTREAVDTFQSTNSERFGTMKGFSYYAAIAVWPFGGRDINGVPGYENPSHVDLTKPDTSPKRALQLLAKFEQLHLKYDSAGRSGVADPNNIDGDIKVNVFELGANFWASKHVRLSANYVLNMFPGSEPTKTIDPSVSPQSSSQRALAPGNTLAKGINDNAHDNAHVLHELLFRMAVAF